MSRLLAPRVGGHQLTENGPVIGLLLEKLEGDFASLDNLRRRENDAA